MSQTSKCSFHSKPSDWFLGFSSFIMEIPGIPKLAEDDGPPPGIATARINNIWGLNHEVCHFQSPKWSKGIKILKTLQSQWVDLKNTFALGRKISKLGDQPWSSNWDFTASKVAFYFCSLARIISTWGSFRVIVYGRFSNTQWDWFIIS